MVAVQTGHQNSLAHHVDQAEAWLSQSADGENTALISYAALEVRFAVERLAVHYWASLLGRKPEEDDLRDTESFKRVERRIYELAGHQKEIDAHFEFMRIFLVAIKATLPLKTPNIGLLSKYWHVSSEYCHIAWPLVSSVPEARRVAFKALSDAVADLRANVQSLGWPVLNDPSFRELRHRYVAGSASTDDVLSYVHTHGIWAQVEYPDARGLQPHGEAVLPIAPLGGDDGVA